MINLNNQQFKKLISYNYRTCKTFINKKYRNYNL